jgi:hypothetical protein
VPNEDDCDDKKDTFCRALEHVFNQFPKYHINILLGDFNTEVGREDIFKLIIGNWSLDETSSDNGIRVINFAT